jgi:uncharacterized membrane protein required for colicin V production
VLPGGLSWLDIVLFASVLGALAVGYVQGFVRQVLNLAAMYLAAIIATQYYRLLSEFFSQIFFTTPRPLLDAVAFFIVFLGVQGLLSFLTADAYKNTRLPFPLVDHLLGAGVGLLSGWIAISLALTILAFGVRTEAWGPLENVHLSLREGLDGSQFTIAFMGTMPTLLNAIKPWLPMGLPAIFNLK